MDGSVFEHFSRGKVGGSYKKGKTLEKVPCQVCFKDALRLPKNCLNHKRIRLIRIFQGFRTGLKTPGADHPGTILPFDFRSVCFDASG
jgi:hypothetical protein